MWAHRISVVCFCFPVSLWAHVLTIEAVLATTDKHYPKTHAAEYEVDRAQGDYLRAMGAFDSRVEMYSRNDPAGG